MAVIIKDGVGYGENAVFLDKSVSPSTGASEKILPAKETVPKLLAQPFPWISWGENNTLPVEMLKSIEGCGILSSIIESQARLALGDGVLWAYTTRDKDGKVVVEEICEEPEILDFMEDNSSYQQEWGWMKDLVGYSFGAARFVLNNEKEPKIVTVLRDDITEVRFAPMDENGKIPNVFLAADWSMITGKDDPKILNIPYINPEYPIRAIQELAKANKKELSLVFKAPTWQKKYYPSAQWQPAQDWINIDRKIPKMKDAMFTHNFRPRYLVIIQADFWEKHYEKDEQGRSWTEYTDAEKQKAKNDVYDEINKHLTGIDNHGKAIFVDGQRDDLGKVYSEIEIKAIDDLVKEGDMLPESATATSEIAFAMKYNPAIIGASLPSGPYTNSQGGSNVRESVTVQILIHEPERKMICRNYNIIKRFNRWDQTYKKSKLRLEPIMPTTILTTLDTGGGTKAAIPGGAPADNPKTSNNP